MTNTPPKGSRGRKPQQSRNTAQSRDGKTRNASKVAMNPARQKPAERGESADWRSTGTLVKEQGRKAPPKLSRDQKPKDSRQRRGMPELKRVQLDAPAPDTVFRDRDGVQHTFPESNLKRVAAHILSTKRKAWRYRTFDFPLFSDRGHEQSFHFDFYIYDAEDMVIRLILVIPFESREVWDKIGRFKRQYPMYHYELWTPEKLARLSGPKGNLGF